MTPAGKEVLLKAVVQAILTYTIAVFKLPKLLCKKLNSMMLRFWWGHKDNLNRMPWLSWGKVGVSKGNGGLDFRDIECFNQALLAKQGWRLVQQPNSLVGKIIKEKYYPHGTFLQSNLGFRPSYA